MIRRWFSYLSALIGCLVFYLAYQEWVSWILLLAVLSLPPLSLVLSLPAMLTARARVEMPPAIVAGTQLEMNIVVHSPLPVPRWRMAVQTYHTVTGEYLLLDAISYCPSKHCGALNCKPQKGWIYDYMGLFRIRLKCPAPFRVLIRPTPLALPEPDLSNILVTAWRPKSGGGFAENHELREYRPGDNLHQIHWKLTAKTDKLILREPMVPDKNRMLVWLTLHGEPEQTDRKLARLLWLGGYLQRQGLKFEVLVYTAAGPQLWNVDSSRSLRRCFNTLLCHSPYPEDDVPILTETVDWDYYIGGEADEEA